MDSTDNAVPRTPASPPESPPLALGLLTLIVYFAGFATVAAWFALMVLGQPGRPLAERGSAASAPLACGVCGVVEQVEEIAQGGLQLSGDKGEGFVVMLALLTSGGDVRTPRAPLYETVVRHDDGSVRAVRDASAPRWKRGDRVRVVKGRIEPGSAADPVFAPAGRTSTPAQPLAQGR